MIRYPTFVALCLFAFGLGTATRSGCEKPEPKQVELSYTNAEIGVFSPPKITPLYQVDTFPTCGWSYQILNDGTNFTIQQRAPDGFRFWRPAYGFSSTNIIDAYRKIKELIDSNCAHENVKKQEEELASKRKTVEIITDNPSEYLK